MRANPVRDLTWRGAGKKNILGSLTHVYIESDVNLQP